MTNSQIVAVLCIAAVVVACRLLLSRRSALQRWQGRLGAIGSPLIEPPTSRVLFLLVVVGVLLICIVPEASFILPALDAVGLDVVTILIAFELRHYLAHVARMLSTSRSVAAVRGLARVAIRCRTGVPAGPVFWLCYGLWAVMFVRALMASTSMAAALPSDADAAAALMNHLVGRWTMAGTLGGKQAVHDVEASWVLKREYVQFHEVSRDRGADGGPAYEAIVLLSWHVKTSEFMCLWLDNTAGGGLSPEGIARGRRSGDAIPVVFTISKRELLRTTFAYDRRADTWRLTIDDVTDGKSDRFGDVTLTRKN